MGSDWTAQDLREFSRRGWTLDEAESQSSKLQNRGSSVAIDRPCTSGDGIYVLTSEQRTEARSVGSKVLSDGGCSRFVPASGAASRMFAALHHALGPLEEKALQLRSQDFPFWSSCQRQALMTLSPRERATQACAWILDPKSGYGHLPKGLIPFHRYPDDTSRCSFEEHAMEWELLAGRSPLHFTVSERHQQQIQSIWKSEDVDIATSVQSPSTDTLAWDLRSEKSARNVDGSLLFRPGGHGALLTNLARMKTPFIFIRNIDNVIPARLMAARNEEQLVLLGRCAALVWERDALLNRPDRGASDWIRDASEWVKPFDANSSIVSSVDELVGLLDRPVRVAGMVKNEGAAGGGPFWIRQANGRVVPSIVESAELPVGGLNGGTHFNPVDLVCNVQRVDGSLYDILQFSNERRYFTGDKEWNGKGIRILERPGLWNGGMDDWLTQFVEVPAATFAPVKTVFDLLDPIRLG